MIVAAGPLGALAVDQAASYPAGRRRGQGATMEKVLHPLGFWSFFGAGLYFLFPAWIAFMAVTLPSGKYPAIILFAIHWVPPLIGAVAVAFIGGHLGTLLGNALDGQRS
jgi:hypothetical protein